MSTNYRNLVPTVQRQLRSKLAAHALDLAGDVVTYHSALSLGTTALIETHASAAFAGRALAGLTDPLGDLDRAYGRLVGEEQAQYLEGFYKDIRDGRYLNDDGELNEALIEARAGSYGERLRGTANESWANSLDSEEKIYWRTDGDEGSCSICPDIAENGPYKASELPTIPGNNETPCLYNCRCYLESESGTEGFKYFLLTSHSPGDYRLFSLLHSHVS